MKPRARLKEVGEVEVQPPTGEALASRLREEADRLRSELERRLDEQVKSLQQEAEREHVESEGRLARFVNGLRTQLAEARKDTERSAVQATRRLDEHARD